jgi:hypothetical protein
MDLAVVLRSACNPGFVMLACFSPEKIKIKLKFNKFFFDFNSGSPKPLHELGFHED